MAWTAPSHYLKQCWNIVNWTLRNKLHWNFNGNSNIFIQENAFENVICEMAPILSRPQCDTVGCNYFSLSAWDTCFWHKSPQLLYWSVDYIDLGLVMHSSVSECVWPGIDLSSTAAYETQFNHVWNLNISIEINTSNHISLQNDTILFWHQCVEWD